MSTANSNLPASNLNSIPPGSAPAATLGTALLQQVTAQIGEAYASWTLADKQIVAQCCSDATLLAIQAAATSTTDTAAQAQLTLDKAQINAQFANIEAAAALDLSGIVWSAVDGLLSNAIDFAISRA